MPAKESGCRVEVTAVARFAPTRTRSIRGVRFPEMFQTARGLPVLLLETDRTPDTFFNYTPRRESQPIPSLLRRG